MKRKILACVMCVLLVLSACMFTACGSSFDGKYEEVSTEQVQTYANEVTKSEMDKNSKGIKLSYSMNMTYKGKETSSSMTITSTISDGKLQGVIEASAKGESDSAEIKLYAKDNYVYNSYKRTQNGEEVTSYKKKIPSLVNFDAVIALADDVIEIVPVVDWTLLELINIYKDELGVKFYMDTTSKNVTKVKISVEIKDGGGDFYFLFNENKEIIGVKMELTEKDSSDVRTVSYSIEYYTGKVKFPKDLDSYETSLI